MSAGEEGVSTDEGDTEGMIADEKKVLAGEEDILTDEEGDKGQPGITQYIS